MKLHPNDIEAGLLNFQASGHYDLNTRVVSYGSNEAAIFNAYVSIHEALHEYLNSVTIYGGVLQTYSYLFLNTRDQQWLKSIRQLIRRCRTPHEIYATFLSALIAKREVFGKEKVLPKDFVSGNTEYLRYFEAGEQISSFFQSYFFKNVAVNAVIYTSMHTPEIYDRLLGKGLMSFDVHAVEAKLFPNEKLLRLLPVLTENFWKETFEEYKQVFSGKDDFPELLAMEKSSNIEGSYRDCEAVNLTYRYFYDAVSQVSSSLGYNTIPLDYHLKSTARLFDLAYKIQPYETSKHKVIPYDSSMDRDHVLATQLENEKILFSKNKYPAQLLLLSKIHDSQSDLLAVGGANNKHAFLVMRSTEQLLHQYTFEEEGTKRLQQLETSSNMYFRRRIVADENVYIELVLVDSILALENVQSIHPDIDWFLNVPYSYLLSNESTSTALGLPQKLFPPVYLLDVSLVAFLKETQQKYAGKLTTTHTRPVKFHRVTMQGNTSYDAVVFLDTVTQDLLIAPCSRVVSTGLLNYSNEREDSVFEQDKSILYGEYQKCIITNLTHVIQEEHSFEFKYSL